MLASCLSFKPLEKQKKYQSLMLTFYQKYVFCLFLYVCVHMSKIFFFLLLEEEPIKLDFWSLNWIRFCIFILSTLTLLTWKQWAYVVAFRVEPAIVRHVWLAGIWGDILRNKRTHAPSRRVASLSLLISWISNSVFTCCWEHCPWTYWRWIDVGEISIDNISCYCTCFALWNWDLQ